MKSKLSKVMFKFDTFEITTREIIVSIGIIAIMFAIGKYISDSIKNNYDNDVIKFEQSLKIENDNDMFKYAIDTKYGDIVACGDFKPVDRVGMDDISKDYIYIKRVEEHYTMHSRTVCTKSGKTTRCRTEHYWTWDYYNSDKVNSKQIEFMGLKFDYDYLNIGLSDKKIKTWEFAHNKRYVYYGIKANKHKATLITNTENKAVEKGSYLNMDKNIEEVYEEISSKGSIFIALFWVLWIVVSMSTVFAFVYFKNSWLETK